MDDDSQQQADQDQSAANPPDKKPYNSEFHKKIQKHQEDDISDSTQEQLNKPLATQVSDDKKEYIKMILKLLEDNVIDPFVPETILNKEIYEKLSDEKKGKVDSTLRNLADMLRMVKEIYEKEGPNNFQIESLIESIRLTKDRIETQKDIGDVYKV